MQHAASPNAAALPPGGPQDHRCRHQALGETSPRNTSNRLPPTKPRLHPLPLYARAFVPNLFLLPLIFLFIFDHPPCDNCGRKRHAIPPPHPSPEARITRALNVPAAKGAGPSAARRTSLALAKATPPHGVVIPSIPRPRRAPSRRYPVATASREGLHPSLRRRGSLLNL